jgi:flagellar hook-length control protein FliK
MENSTSLRFLEASGRPSGTGRPSLTSPRADQERAGQGRKSDRPSDDRAEAAREERELRRKSRAQADGHKPAAHPAEEEQKPFDELLEGAKQAPATDGQAPADEQAAQAAPTQPRAGETAQGASGAKSKKSDAAEPDASLLQVLTDPETKTPALPLTTLLGGAAPSAAKNARPQPDANAAVAAVAVAPAGNTSEQAASGAVEELPAGFEPVEPNAAPVRVTAELASTRDASQVAQPMLSTPASTEAAPPVEAKTPPAPPPPADSERAGEILRQMRVQLSPELRTATIQLSPPELGRISIRMRVERGELRAHVRAERPETLQALERHVPELKATLESLGIQAREIDLQLGFEQQGTRQQPSEPRANGASGASNESDSQVREHERRLARTLAARTGGIDTYA